MTVGEMLDRMTAAELVRWRRMYSEEPFGFARDDWRSALQTAMTLAPHAGKKTIKPEQCLLKFGRPGRQTAAEMQEAVKTFTRKVKGTIR